MDAAALARALGGEVARWPGGVQVRCPGIGHSAGDRSVSILLGSQFPNGVWVKVFGSGDALAERGRVLAALGAEALAVPALEASSPARNRKATADKNALWLWQEARHPAGTRVEQYLRHRGL